MTMSAPPGFAASSLTDERPEMTAEEAATDRRPRSAYLRRLSLRREAAVIRQQTVYGLVIGWVLTLVAGFLYFCVPSRVDWLWATLMGVGGLHLAAAVLLPQALAWPERAWIAIARWQGWLVMTILLTIVYFALIWPASFLSRRRMHGFVSWDDQPPQLSTDWETIELAESEFDRGGGHYRSLPVLLAGVVGFFFRQGNYVLLPIIILLMVLGLVLYFVQSSALAPFVYTLF
jgi:hypothetical protein